MMEMFSPLLNDYSERFTTGHDSVLQQIHDEARQSHAHAHMLSTHVQGKLLEMMSVIMRPKYILEIGTFVGYSAICLAKGLQEGGELHTLELREADAATAKANFHRVNLDKKIHLHVGNALDIIPNLDIQWDLVFIDADKISYTQYYELVLPRLSDRGMIIADNVLFHGEVLEEPVKGKSAKAIQAFNQHVMDDERSEQVLVTMRDGLLLIRKKLN